MLTQTIPTVAIAPLLVLWFGYDMAPKVVLIVVTTFFPITVGLLGGFRSVDPGRSISCAPWEPAVCRSCATSSCRRLCRSSSAVSRSRRPTRWWGAVFAEWLGGFSGLGVYMTRVRKAYSFDKLFAVIFLLSALSLALMWLVERIRRAVMPWERASR